MMAAFQPSLFDEAFAPTVGTLAPITRLHLTQGAWVDHLPGWLTGCGEVFETLLRVVPWRSEERLMYDAIVAVPRLVHTYGIGQALPHPALEAARVELNQHYFSELGEPFVTAGCCLYRDGRDSVAWHGDNIGRGRRADTMVAIISFGSDRKLLLRPRGGQTELTLTLSHGDLVVMGGSCQRTWEHAVPKTTRPVGPRLSVQFRPRNVF